MHQSRSSRALSSKPCIAVNMSLTDNAHNSGSDCIQRLSVSQPVRRRNLELHQHIIAAIC